ncbi:MAG: ABC-F family ATP-binding cassette domain-containing protein [Erysipelotrichaceae bacterium]|nr:ABC-F family ATP-binding cassette domain-containing protein [Erysipelotrichaceae bacterium]
MLISASNITKYQADRCVLADISINIDDNDKVAILGINGAGKTTLLNVLTKTDDCDGTIIYKKDLRIAYLRQDQKFDLTLSIIEQIKILVDLKNVADYEISSITSKMKLFDLNQQLNTMSGGQLKRLALAITLLKPCDLLVLDEPTNHLDNDMIDYLENYLIKFNKGLVLVTHDRYFLERVVHKIYEIDRTRLYEYDANYSHYLELKEIRERNDQQAETKRKQFLKKELEWIIASPQARSTKQKSRIQRFEQLSAKAEIQKSSNVQMISAGSRLGKKTIELVNVTKEFDQPLFSAFSYVFKSYDRIGILGDNATGKTTLLNIIAQRIKPTSGEVIYGETVRLGYFKQGLNDMDDTLRVIDYINETAVLFTSDEGTLTSRNLAERFLFDKQLQYSQISRLSGGQKRRLYLLKTLMQRPNVLLLDEPTNDLDIQTLQILEDYLDDFAGIVITVSHDRYFLDRVCTGLFILKDRFINYQNGGYSENINSSTSVNKKNKSNTEPIKKVSIKLSFQEKKEMTELELMLPEIENQLKTIDQQLSQTLTFPAMNELLIKRNSLALLLEQKTERLMQLMEKDELANQR